MANTRQSAKRARQESRRRDRNTITRQLTRTAFRNAFDAIKKGDLEPAKAAYIAAVKALAKAASKGSVPRERAARKTSRLTLLAKKVLPNALNFR